MADPANPHLDEEDGRIWLRLELRALARALETTGDASRRWTRSFSGRTATAFHGVGWTLELADGWTVRRRDGGSEVTR